MTNIRSGGMQSLPPVVKNLIIINVLVWIAQLTFKDPFNNALSLHFYQNDNFGAWQLFTYMFLHAPNSFFHILFNMFGLWMFGSPLENFWGSKKFLIFYIICGIGAGLIQELSNVIEFNIYMSRFESGAISKEQAEALLAPVYHGTAVGASGAIMGIFAAYAYTFPNNQLLIMPIPVPIKAKYAIVGLILLDVFGGINPQMGSGVAHFAHLGGVLFGFILVKFMNRPNRSNRRDFYR